MDWLVTIMPSYILYVEFVIFLFGLSFLTCILIRFDSTTRQIKVILNNNNQKKISLQSVFVQNTGHRVNVIA